MAQDIKQPAPPAPSVVAPPQGVNKIITVQNMVKRYAIGDRYVEILHSLSVDIEPGEFVMLIGPSGCGKSTFMYIMFGLEFPTEGKVWYRDVDLYALKDEKRTRLRSEKITMIHQQPIWIKALTVKENIAFPLLLRRASKQESIKQAIQLLEVLHLEKLADKHPSELSVGEQQRCSFMRSLITNPEVVFADEPTGNLDTDASIVVMELFKKINEKLGKTIVMVTHNLSHLPYASKVVSMLDGRIEKVEVKRPPANAHGNGTDMMTEVRSWLTERQDNTQPPVPTSAPAVSNTTVEGAKT